MRAKLKFVLTITIAFHSCCALAAGIREFRSQAPEVRVHWVDAKGSLLTEPAAYVHARWIWNDDQVEMPKLEKGGPALRIEVDTGCVPASWRLIRADGDDGEVVGISEAKPGARKLRRVVFDQLAVVSGYDLEFDTGGGHRERLSAAISVEWGAPALLVRPKSCPKHRVQLTSAKNGGHHLFIGLYCYDDFWNTYFYAVRSRDSSWAYAGMPPENQPRALVYKIEDSSDNTSYTGDPVTLRTRDSDQAITEVVLHYAASKNRKKE